MKWLRRTLDIDPRTIKAKLFLLVVDKLIIGLFVLAVIGVFLLLRSDWEIARTERAAEAQINIERTRLEKEILPFILQESSDVMASGYLLSSALSAKQFDAQVAIEIVSALRARGLPDSHILRIVELALPEGLPAIARHAARLLSEISVHENLGRTTYASAIPKNDHGVPHIASKQLPLRLQESLKERLLWADALRKFLPHVSTIKEEQIATSQFLTRYIGDLFFLF